jgi:nucleoside-diphosphate-sugar epimerase
MGARVLVTGAGGFLGRWAVASLLQRRVDTIAVLTQRSAAPTELSGARIEVCDLLDGQAARDLIKRTRPDVIVHFAWNATPGLYWTTPDNFSWLSATVALAQRHFENGGARFVLAGTCAEYDWASAALCEEAKTPTVLSTPHLAKPYALCKALARVAVEGLARRFEQTTATGRIFFQFGPYEHPNRLAPAVIRALLSGTPIETTHGRQVRDFLHARDVGDAFAALALCNLTGPINIGSGDAVTLAAFISEIARQVGREELVLFGARQAPPDEPAILRPDIRHLRDEIAWRPHFTLETGVADTIAWWRTQQGE